MRQSVKWNRRAVRLALTLGAALIVSPGARGASAQEEFRWHGSVDRGDLVEIKGVNGEIVASPSSGGEVEITARKHSRHDDPASVKIEVVEHEGGVTVCAVYSSRRGKRPNECEPGQGGQLGAHNSDVVVDFTVHIPRGTPFHGRTVNGRVRARDLDRHVNAETVNGGIEVTTAGSAEAATVNGSIDATLGAAGWDGEMSFHTVNGSINLALPEGVNADVSAETVNGELSTDFPLTVSGRLGFGAHRLHGTIGKGGDRLDLKTVNGAIHLRKSR
ncbi:MAG: DUF4097 domain-containing protein [Gemmatimonadota bacterium]